MKYDYRINLKYFTYQRSMNKYTMLGAESAIRDTDRHCYTYRYEHYIYAKLSNLI